MNSVLTDLSNQSLADACEANLHEFFKHLIENVTVGEYVRGDGTVRWNTPMRHPWFQGVLSSRPARDGDSGTIEEAADYFRSEGVPGFSWWLETDVKGRGWEELLTANGFEYDESTPGMGVALASVKDDVAAGRVPGLKVAPVGDDEAMDAWARVCSEGFAMGEPGVETLRGLAREMPLRHYVGRMDGEVVATSTLFLGAGVAGVYNVATLEAARRKGVGAALTAAPLLDAREMGYAAGILQSTDMGYRVYERMGFALVRKIGNWYLKL